MRRSKKVMENYVCPNCWQQIQSCTCEHYPPWELINIDVNIQEIIRILNKKGYTTIGCCESHFDGNYNMYVAFMMNFNIGCPDGFTFGNGKSSINYMFKKSDMETKDKYNQIKSEKLKSLLAWAESLPENPHMFKR